MLETVSIDMWLLEAGDGISASLCVSLANRIMPPVEGASQKSRLMSSSTEVCTSSSIDY